MLPRTPEPEVMDSTEEAAAYDAMDHRAVNDRFVDDLLAVHPYPRRVIDLGAGTGLIPIVLAARTPHATVTGVDLAASMLRRAGDNVGRAGLAHRISLVVADVRALPWKKGEFDVVMSNSLAHHLPDPGVLFRAVASLAGEGTTIFLRDLSRPASADDLDHLVERYAASDPPLARTLFRASLHAALTVEEVRLLARANGLGDAKIEATSDRHWTLVRPAAP